MKGKVFSKFPYEVTPEERRQISRLHFEWGVIWGRFKEMEAENASWQRKQKGIVYLYKEGSRVLGWAVCYKNDKFGRLRYFQTYVCRKDRRRGIGTKLYNCARNQFKTCRFSVERHDHISMCFYDSVKCQS